MLNNINYLRMKKALIKNFRNQKVYIEIKGILSTRMWIDKCKILVNNHKIILQNEELDCTILLDFIKKIKIDKALRIELIGMDAQYILEV